MPLKRLIVILSAYFVMRRDPNNVAIMSREISRPVLVVALLLIGYPLTTTGLQNRARQHVPLAPGVESWLFTASSWKRIWKRALVEVLDCCPTAIPLITGKQYTTSPSGGELRKAEPIHETISPSSDIASKVPTAFKINAPATECMFNATPLLKLPFKFVSHLPMNISIHARDKARVNFEKSLHLSTYSTDPRDFSGLGERKHAGHTY